MTRINANILPKFLSDHHLRAEQKEIARLPMLFRTRLNSTGNVNGNFNQGLPLIFTLGNGHLLFFMNKGRWAWERANQLTLEMQNRGLKPIQHNQMAWDEFAMYDTKGSYPWHNTERILVINRIIDKMLERLRIREDYGVSYKNKKETPEKTIKRLLESLE